MHLLFHDQHRAWNQLGNILKGTSPNPVIDFWMVHEPEIGNETRGHDDPSDLIIRQPCFNEDDINNGQGCCGQGDPSNQRGVQGPMGHPITIDNRPEKGRKKGDAPDQKALFCLLL